MSLRLAANAIADVAGDAELRRRLLQLADKDVDRATRKAVGSGLSVLQRAMRGAVEPATTAGHNTRNIQRAIRSRFVKNRRVGQIQGKVGVGVGRRAASRNAPHFHLYVLGTGDRFTGQKSIRRRREGRLTLTTGAPRHYRGRAPAHDVIATTARSLERVIVHHMADVLRDFLNRLKPLT